MLTCALKPDASGRGQTVLVARRPSVLTPSLLFRRHASLYTSLADLYCAFRMVILRCCYHQILGPCRHFPKLANGRCRHSDIWVRLDPHLTRQATKSYVECGNAFGLILH